VTGDELEDDTDNMNGQDDDESESDPEEAIWISFLECLKSPSFITP
jgi:hypothetical protein